MGCATDGLPMKKVGAPQEKKFQSAYVFGVALMAYWVALATPVLPRRTSSSRKALALPVPPTFECHPRPSATHVRVPPTFECHPSPAQAKSAPTQLANTL
jgi:hypothetical protein